MKSSKIRRALMLLACAVLLVCLSVGATLAYLQDSTKAVNNTFTVGNVTLEDEDGLDNGLDEADVDVYGNPIEGADRVLENEYKLIPAHTYTKDPTVHVKAGSEPCYVFVKVENGIAEIEAEGDTTIAEQMKALGWTQLIVNEAAVENVFYYNGEYSEDAVVNALEAQQDLVVFNSFTLAGNADVEKYQDNSIVITAYAIQADGFNGDPAAAWVAGGFQ